jgi:hypothetical protein
MTMTPVLWILVGAFAILALIGLGAQTTQANREARCRKHGHRWEMRPHGNVCSRCRLWWRT